ncbi:MAG: hypothetical protein ACD_9C00214G0002 [uncultured bacterium]|nr:MAG: hypothetical protein ACD_9C00214G0002 [uncultured bacterium]
MRNKCIDHLREEKMEKNKKFYIIDQKQLPNQYPTHKHAPEFWEALGRAVATFGFLEEVLGKVIFVLTGTRPFEESEIDRAYKELLPRLERALSDPLGGLINSFENAVKEHPDAKKCNIKELVKDLREASKVRNVICHGSWRIPDSAGASLPLFVNSKMKIVDTKIDCAFLYQLQKHANCLACWVIDVVTCSGLPFPWRFGSSFDNWHKGHIKYGNKE